VNRDDVIRMAREAGFVIIDSHHEECAERFSALVAAAEREKQSEAFQQILVATRNQARAAELEACAKVCDELAGMLFCHGDKDGAGIAMSLRDEIRARGETN
jgi:hypothetical protein